MNDDQLAFIEELGVSFEHMGATPMLGRVLAALLISEEPELSAEDLATILQASRGSISQTTRVLVDMHMIRRVRKTGVRRDFFRVVPDAWVIAVQRKNVEIRAFRQLLERALSTLPEASQIGQEAIQESIDFARFWEDETDQIHQKWQTYKEALHAQRNPDH